MHIVITLKQIVLASSRNTLISVLDGLGTKQCVEVMVAIDVKHIVGCICPCIGVALTIGTAHRVDIAWQIFSVERSVEKLRMLQTKVCLQGKTLDRLYFQISITEDAPALVGVVTFIVDLLNRVGKVRLDGGHRTHEAAI